MFGKDGITHENILMRYTDPSLVSSDTILSFVHSQEQTQGPIAPNVPFPTRFVYQKSSVENWISW